MAHEYPDDGHIYVCVRVRDVATVPGMAFGCGGSSASSGALQSSRRAARENIRDAQRICVSTLEDVVVLHDPKTLDDSASVARDAEGVVQFLTHRMSAHRSKRLERKFLTATATANYFHYDRCLNSMDTPSMLQMPLICNSDFLRPPEYGSQEDVYLCTATHAVTAALEGINSCVFAYGQTGSGKTYTLFGDTTCIRRDPGVVPRTLDDLFQRLEAIRREYASDSETAYSFRVQMSFFEIYQNEVYCLLSRKGPLRMSFSRDAAGKEETMVIHDLQQHVVTSAEKAYPLVEMGLRRRQTGETGMNARSSRSHGIIHLRVTQWRTNRISNEAVEHNATLNLVDLAGSERQKTAKTDGKNREEGIQINQSLATLARVINEISRGAKYVNYRDSLLTMLLKDNLGGNSKTFMIATIAPVSFCYQESCATLLYARDVRKIRNRPMVNKTFQTRSNLLELNARLKQENEHLKQHIERLLTDIRNHELEEGCTTVKAPDSQKDTVLADDATLSAVIAAIPAPTVGGVTAPFIITTHRVRASITGLGGSYVKGGHVGVTPLTKDSVRFRIADLTGETPSPGTAQRCTGGEHNPEERASKGNETEENKEKTQVAPDWQRDLGAVEFERVSHRSCEQRVWVRFVPPTGDVATCPVECQVNGKILRGGDDCQQVSHGDVICVYLEGSGDQQSLLTLHYVDVNSLARSAAAPTVGDLVVSHALPEAPSGKENEVEHLRRENAKLLDMLQAQACTINYQRQRGAHSRSRLASLSNNYLDPITQENSPSPIPTLPIDRMEAMELPTIASLQMTTAALTFCRSSVSPLIREHSRSVMVDVVEETNSSGSQGFDRSAWQKQSFYKGAMEHSARFKDLERQLAELETSASPVCNAPEVSVSPPAFKIPKPSLNDKPTLGDERPNERTKAVKKENQEKEEEEKEEEREGKEEKEEKEVGEGAKVNVEQQGPSTKTENPPENLDSVEYAKAEALAEDGGSEADDILRSHREKLENEKEIGRVQLLVTGSDGVCERYYAAKRERVLCERIWSLERTIEDIRGDMSLLESRLRIAQDGSIENELRQAMMDDEMKEVSKALLEATEENAVLQREIASLETFLSRTEEALAAASAMNEAELEKRVAEMANEIRGMKTLARMWKRRAMQLFAQQFGGENGGAGSEDADIVSGLRSGHVPWDDLRVESNVERAKKLLGERGPTATAVKAIGQFEKDTAIESIVALERVLAKLEQENLRLMDDIRSYEQELQNYKELVPRLRKEKEQLEKKRIHTNSTAEESKKLKTLYTAKCAELEQAERQCATVEAKLRAAVQKTGTVKKKSAKSNDLLLKEQQLMLEEQRGERDKLRQALTAKDEELRSVLRFLEDEKTTQEMRGNKDEEELRDRIEQLLEDALAAHGTAPNGGYSVFPPDFEFPEEIVALIRVCLRILMDRLKIELYVLNRQSLHKLCLLVPAVQLRPEAQFHSFMHELRGVVVEMAGKPQRIGGKWGIEEPDVLASLVDHRRRRAGNALNGLLIWYDHWDLSPKSEHVCYMELIRNSDRVMQLARLVRQESLVNTNATSTLRIVLPNMGGAPGVATVPEPCNDTSVRDSRRILEKLSSLAKRSNLARVASNARPADFQRSRTTASVFSTPRPSGRTTEATTVRQVPPRATVEKESFPPTVPFARKEKTITNPNVSTEQVLEEGKFGRRATALVVPVTENDVAFAAASAVAREGTNLNFARGASAANIPEERPSANAGRNTFAATTKSANRFARARTDILSSFAAFADLRRPPAKAAPPSPTPRESARGGAPHASAAKTPASAKRRAADSAADSFRRTRTAFAATAGGHSPLGSRASGRRPVTRVSVGSTPATPQPRTKFVGLSRAAVPVPFYDPSVMMSLREGNQSGSYQQIPPPPQTLRNRSAALSPKGAAAPAKAATPLALSRTMSGMDKAKARRSGLKALDSFPEIPRLRFDTSYKK